DLSSIVRQFYSAIMLSDGRALVFLDPRMASLPWAARIYDPVRKTLSEAGGAFGPEAVLLSDDRVLLENGILDPNTLTLTDAAVSTKETDSRWLLADGRVWLAGRNATAVRIFTPPNLQDRPASISSVSITPLESG